jgi:hypothetical protein
VAFFKLAIYQKKLLAVWQENNCTSSGSWRSTEVSRGNYQAIKNSLNNAISLLVI